MYYGKEEIIVYNIHTMTDKIKAVDVNDGEYLDLVVETCSRIICFEYNNDLCNCTAPSDCHGHNDFIKSAKGCIGAVSAFSINVFEATYIDKSEIN